MKPSSHSPGRRVWKAATRGINRAESGDTLIEVLVAVVIIGLTVVALMGTLTTSITSSATYRSLATVDTVLKNFAEAVKDEVQLAPAASSLYSNCAPTYRIVSTYPTSPVAGAGVTVFGTGLTAYQGQSVTVIVGATQIPSSSFIPPTSPIVATDGTVSATFALPLSIGVGTTDNVSLIVGLPPIQIQSATPLTVMPATTGTPPPSAAAGYHVAISSIGSWNDAISPSTGDFDYGSNCSSNPNDDSGIQMVTIQAIAPNNVQDTLGIIVTDPGYSAPPGGSWSAVPISVIASTPSTPPIPGQAVTFTATVTGANSSPPAGTLSWDISGSPSPVNCSNPNPTLPSGSSGDTSTWTCVMSAAEVGADTYTAAVSYSGDVNNSPETGSGVVTISPFTMTSMQLNGATQGLVQQGDSLALTFNAPINENAFCNTWTGTGDQTLGGGFTVATFTDGVFPNDDTLTVSRSGAPGGCQTVNFGSIDLGSSNYVSGGNVTFSGSNPNATKIAWTASTNTLTITLGGQNSGPTSPGTTAPVSASRPSYTGPITDVLGDPIVPSPAYQGPNPKSQF